MSKTQSINQIAFPETRPYMGRISLTTTCGDMNRSGRNDFSFSRHPKIWITAVCTAVLLRVEFKMALFVVWQKHPKRRSIRPERPCFFQQRHLCVLIFLDDSPLPPKFFRWHLVLGGCESIPFALELLIVFDGQNPHQGRRQQPQLVSRISTINCIAWMWPPSQ